MRIAKCIVELVPLSPRLVLDTRGPESSCASLFYSTLYLVF